MTVILTNQIPSQEMESKIIDDHKITMQNTGEKSMNPKKWMIKW